MDWIGDTQTTEAHRTTQNGQDNQNDRANNYPDPDATYVDPYPVLPQREIARGNEHVHARSQLNVSHSSTFRSGCQEPTTTFATAQYPNSAFPDLASASTLPVYNAYGQSVSQSGPSQAIVQRQDSYSTLAEQNSIRHGNAENQRSWRFPGSDGVGYGAPDQRPRLRSQAQDGYESEEIVYEGRPMANVFLNAPVRPTQPDNVEQDPDYEHVDDDGQQDDDDMDEESRLSSTSGVERRGRRGQGRGSGKGRAKGRRGGYKALLKGTTHDPALNKRQAREREFQRGRSRGRAGRAGRGKRQIDPGQDFKDALTKANQALLDEKYQEGLEHALVAVQANPEVFAAHNLLSLFLEKLGREADSLAALLCGANTVSDALPWKHAAERTLQFAGESGRTKEVLEQAVYCYSLAIKRDSEDCHARTRKLHLLIELGDSNRARLESKNMLRIRPYDVENVRQYAELCAETGDGGELSRAKSAYDRALEHHYAESRGFGDPEEQWSQLNVYLELIDRIGAAEEGVLKLKRYARWFLGRKDETFWEGFDDDREFDKGQERRGYVPQFQQGKACNDRKKYGDGLPLELRVKLGLFRVRMGMRCHEEALKHFQHLLSLTDEVGDYYDMFFQVADCLRANRLYEEAVKFYEPVMKMDDLASIDFLMGLGETFAAVKRFDEAETSFNLVLEQYDDHVQARIELARMFEMQGQRDKALKFVSEVIQMGRKKAIEGEGLPLPPRRSGGRGKRSGIFRRDRKRLGGHMRKSQPRMTSSVNSSDDEAVSEEDQTIASEQPTPSNHKRNQSDHQSQRADIRVRFEERFRQLEDERAGVRVDYKKMQELWPAVEDGQDENAISQWMNLADRIIGVFRATTVFYPRVRDSVHSKKFTGFGKSWVRSGGKVAQDVEALRSRLEANLGDDDDDDNDDDDDVPAPINESVPKDFHNITFREWHRIMINLALLYAKKGEQVRCYELLKTGVFRANVFYYDDQLHDTTLAASLACGLIFNDSAFVNENARKYIADGDMRAGMSYQLLAGVSRLSHGLSYFNAGPPQKFILRAVKMLDYDALPAEMRDQYEWSGMCVTLSKRRERLGPTPEGTGELDAGLLLHYGHQVSTANHSVSALPYFFRVLALRPEDPGLNLAIATMYVQTAMKRQTENRQYGIAQGLAFLHRYYDIRAATGKASHLQEAKYNMARMWHLLGLTHLAVPAYEAALALSPKVQEELLGEMGDGEEWDPEDFAQEAALALQQIFALAGNDAAARSIGEEWLVI